MSNPYEALPLKAFWRSAIAERDPSQIDGLWSPKFPIAPEERIVTAGSCFAQHIGRALVDAGYAWYDAEPAPAQLSEEAARKFNYGIFSFRTGNIYTVALLHQWVSWAFGASPPSSEVWAEDGRFYDPFRPAIEPRGFASETELFVARDWTLRAIRNALSKASVFVFTLGLTEAWRNKRDGAVYPVCPGTVAGAFDPQLCEFLNYRYAEIRRDLQDTVDIIRAKNPGIRFLLTVSPVPLVATASAHHVLVATTYSKSTLRAVAGDLAAERADIDYFPAYEIVSGFPFKGMFYGPNLRSVTNEGVEFVMNSFFAGLGMRPAAERVAATADSRCEAVAPTVTPAEDLVCEELALEAFAGSSR
jgi:hypothetical protein